MKPILKLFFMESKIKIKGFFSFEKKLETIQEITKRQIKIPNPAKTEIKRPAKSGSLKNLKKAARIHIKKGCLPSVTETNLKVSTFLIICDQRT